jgi:hypothetical protein
MKIRPAGAELFHAGRDMTKLIVAFHNSAKAPKNKPNASLKCCKSQEKSTVIRPAFHKSNTLNINQPKLKFITFLTAT